jgi:hypothetical protein
MRTRRLFLVALSWTLVFPACRKKTDAGFETPNPGQEQPGVPVVVNPESSETPPAVCKPEREVVLDLQLVGQDSSMLCWAGVTQSIAKWFARDATQCEQVQARNPECPCASCPTSMALADGPCNRGGWPNFDRIGLRADRLVGKALPLDQLKQEISCKKRPVAFTWRTGPTSGHIMVAHGYVGDLIWVADPWPMCTGMTRLIDYETYDHGEEPGTTSHWDDFYGIAEKG